MKQGLSRGAIGYGRVRVRVKVRGRVEVRGT